MRTMLERINKTLKKKKGFSLVELIIVIAIMAALVAILAPQYTKYVEKSRQSADQTQMDEIAKALKVAVVDPDITPDDGTLIIDNTDGTCTILKGTGGSTISDDIINAVETAIGVDSFELKSANGKAAGDITFTVAADTYEVTCDVDYSGWDD